ncbi:MAG TPA: HYR domain-containing protein, partial [Nitrosopumilaceae archaeon]|nr:HYR domain-containing protein [Nitrosopumilaceae archaeon]
DHNSVDLGLPSAYDGVGVLSMTNDAPTYFPLGQTIVTWTAKDASGNDATAKQIITIQDTTPPIIHAPSDITMEATSTTNNVIDLGNSTVTDNGIIQSVTNNAPKTFPIGTTTVTWTAKDAAGNGAADTQTVKIVDTTAPKLTPPSNVVFEATSITDNQVPLGNATVTDNGLIQSIDNNAPKLFPFGKTLILWTAKDAAGNISNSTQTVDVVDTTAPKIIPPKDIKVEATSLTDNTVSLGNATATDVEQVAVSNNVTKSFSLGKTLILWTAKDAAGNISNSTQTVDVVDTTAPKIIPPKDITFEATSLNNNTIPLGTPTVTDLEQVTVTNNAPKVFGIGLTTVTWIAVDTSGNSVNATQTVDVRDTTAPKLIIPNDIRIEATSVNDNVVFVGKANATDAVGVESISNNAPTAFPIGTTAITWTAKDAAGNISNSTQTVDVVDTTAPKIIPPKDIKVEATSLTDNTVSLGNATATDVEQVAVSNNAPSAFPIGTTAITWTAKDAAGNISNATQTVDVMDTTAPKIIPPKDITFEATSLNNNTVPLGNITTSDIEPITLTNDAPKLFPFGKTLILWTAKDAAGNISNATQTVDVMDTTAPKIIPPKDIKVEATSLTDNTISLGNATATDVEQVTVSNNAPTAFPIGTTAITWTAKDAAGNISNATQTVDVMDTTAPKIIPPKDIKVEATSLTDNTVSLGNATATDVEQVAVSNNDPSAFPIGTTAITWTAKDAAGNISNATQTVDVVDITAPIIVAPKNIIVNATSPTSNNVEIGNATAKDAVGVASITNDAPQVFPFGQTIVTWKATDTSGNAATAIQKITIVDRSPPQLNIPADIVVNATAFEMPIQIGQATASGIIDTSPKITNNATASFSLGKTIIEWNAIDKFGNSKSLVQSVTVLACGKPESSYNLVMGTENDDILVGKGSTPNLIIGLDGNDIIRAGTSGDCIIAGNGDNVIFGGNGDDTIIAGNGNNIIKGDSGNDKITIGTGSNIVDGGDGHNTCTAGNASHDTIVNCEVR